MSELFEQVRQLINDSGESRYSIWQATGITQSQLSQFMAGNKGLSIEALELVIDHLGYFVELKKNRRGM